MLTLAHISTDLSYDITGNSFDEYQVKLDDKPIATIRFEYNELNETIICTGDSSMIPNCTSNSHLVASVNMQLIKGYNEDHSFYHEQFYDSETGESKEIELVILPL